MDSTITNLDSIKTIVIANIGEFYQPIFRHFNKREQRTWIETSRAEGDMALFWAGDDKIVITPDSIDPQYISYVCATLGYQNVHLLSTSTSGESLCSDIEADSNLFSFLVEAINRSNQPQIISWGATKSFYKLIGRLQQKKVKFTFPDVPEPINYWTVPYLDSKCGFREVCTDLSTQASNIQIPNGFVCADINVTACIAKSRVFPSGFVVKANNGVGGYGTLLYSPQRIKSNFNIDAHLNMSIKLMPVLSNGVIVLEEYIASQANTEISSPSIQGRVTSKGKVNITGLAGQIIDSQGRYVGTIIGPDVFTESLSIRLRDIGQMLGLTIAKIGYKGVFNIDTVIDKDGAIYCVELNARRTSVKYVLDLATWLLGPSFANKVTIITNERFSSKQLLGCTYSNIRSQLSNLLFPINGEPQGVIVTIISSLSHFTHTPRLGFAVIGENFKKAHSIYTEVRGLLLNMECFNDTFGVNSGQ